MTHTRYRVALAGVMLHLMIGSVYAWSVFNGPIVAKTHFDESAVSFAFSLAIFCLGTSAAFMGRLVEKYTPRVTGTIAAILFGSGMMLSGLAVHTNQIWLLLLGYGVVGGIGLGAGYVTPVSTIIKWFPDKRGFATGLAIMGFGFAAMLTSPVAQHLIQDVGIEATFYVLGGIYMVVMLIAAQFIRRPQPGELPDVLVKAARKVSLTDRNMTAKQALKTKEFPILWLMLFINITGGIGLISVASPMTQSTTGMTAATAAVMVGVLGLFNGFGRLLWAALSDRIGRPLTFSLLFIVNIVMMATLLAVHQPFAFVLAFCLIESCYGAGFSILPAYLGDVFGTKELGTIHGYALTAWAAAGIVGPVLVSFTHQLLGNYQITVLAFMIFDIFALLLSVQIRRYFTKDRSVSTESD